MLAGVMDSRPKKKQPADLSVSVASDDDGRAPSPVGNGSTTPVEQLRELFIEIDTDGSGLLDRAEVKALAEKLGVELTRRELDEAMSDMDEDGSGEVDFEEFCAWWPKQAGKNSKLVAAMSDRYQAAMDRVLAKRQAAQEASEAEAALAAVAKSHGKLVSQINTADEKNKALMKRVDELKGELRDAADQRHAAAEAAAEAAADYEAQIRSLEGRVSELEREKMRAESSTAAERARREQDVRTLTNAHEEMEAAVGRKELRTEALEGQVSGLRAAVQRLREGNGNERARTAQVQADLEATTARLQRSEQLAVARREEQITRLLKTLERMREQEAVLVADLTAMTAKKDQYKGELRELRAMVKESFERGRAAKAEADQRTAFTIIK